MGKFITEEGLKKIKDELENRKVTIRQSIANAIKEAKEQGDLSENAEYSEAKRQQAENEARIAELEFMLKESTVVKYDKTSGGVQMGSKVMVKFSAQGGSASGGDYFPEKSAYRKFKIKTVEGQSDVDCLREVLERRIARILTQNDADRWPAPDVILIDGGKPQVNAAMQILKKHKLNIPLVGIAKGPERKRNDFIFGVKTREFIKFVNENQDLLIRVRDEAHRFAITFQRSLRKLKH